MSSIVSIDTRGYDISMGPGFLRVGGGGGIAGNVYINGNVGIRTNAPTAPLHVVTNSTSYPDSNGIWLNNPTNSAGRHSIIGARVAGTSAGNVWLSMDVLNQTGWSIGIDNRDNQKLKIQNSWDFLSNPEMTIDRNGNVGIGTTNPTTTLDVAGTMGVTGAMTVTQTGANSFAQFLRNTTGEGLGWNSRLSVIPYLGAGGYNTLSAVGDVGIIWGVAGSGTNGNLVIAPHTLAFAGLKIMSDGKVGIGKTTPTATLDVYGPSVQVNTALTEQSLLNVDGRDYLNGDGGTTVYSAGITLKASDLTWAAPNRSYGAKIYIGGGYSVSGAVSHAPITFHTAGAEQMRVNNDGRVGIGKTAPAATLDVSGVIRANGGVIIGSNGEFLIEKSATSKTLLISHISNPHTPICFINNFPGGTTRVGIDTTNPAYNLDVSGTAMVRGVLQTTDTTESTSTTTGALQVSGGAGIVKNLNVGGKVFVNGNVGIGTTNPTTTLDVAGTMTVTGQVAIGTTSTTASTYLDINYFKFYTNGYVSFYRQSSTANHGAFDINSNWGAVNRFVFSVRSDGNVINWNGSYGAISDLRFKENIIDTPPKLEDLKKVRIVNYNIIGDTDKSIGVIAQELENIFPRLVEESVDKNTNTPYKTVKYSIFIPILIKAVQEQQTQIEQLKIQNQTQQTLLEQLQQRIQALENK